MKMFMILIDYPINISLTLLFFIIIIMVVIIEDKNMFIFDKINK